jgi:hypothetical protein
VAQICVVNLKDNINYRTLCLFKNREGLVQGKKYNFGVHNVKTKLNGLLFFFVYRTHDQRKRFKEERPEEAF